MLEDDAYSGPEFATAATKLDVPVPRLVRADKPDAGGDLLVPLRERNESTFWTFKATLGVRRDGAPTLAGLRERILSRTLCLAI